MEHQEVKALLAKLQKQAAIYKENLNLFRSGIKAYQYSIKEIHQELKATQKRFVLLTNPK